MGFPRRAFKKDPKKNARPNLTLHVGPSLPPFKALALPKRGQPKPVIVFPDHVLSQFSSRHRGQPGHDDSEPEDDAEGAEGSTPQSVRFSSPIFFPPEPHPEEELKKARKEKYRQKKQRQHDRWREVTIPELEGPYMDYVRRVASAECEDPPSSECNCQGTKSTISLPVVFWDHIEDREVVVCPCTSIAHRLILAGLFPSAPQRPSLAIDIKLLELTRVLFLHVAPNVTAWTSTLEYFLEESGQKLQTRDSLRRRFGNALRWYSHLVNQKRLMVGRHLLQVRNTKLLVIHNALNLAPPASTTPHSSPTSCPCPTERDTSDVSQNDTAGRYAEGNRPSLYLQSRCPLCFGGQGGHDPSAPVDVIACLDACFTQKRRSGPHDSGRLYPRTVFLSDAEISAMEATVELLRPSKPSQNKHPRGSDAADIDDKCEGPLRVPNSVLDGCESSFKAADEQREKASTTFFDDTGLMALLCRHDRVLWLANMTTAGERQHYSLALVDKFFQHLPLSYNVGLLYDIGCQLHRSCHKWNFLPEVLDRIVFAISVFHAYGHQWPCQVIYHPRKCIGFGFSDGEGCERFWSWLSHLIPCLRVCSSGLRYDTIDEQVCHLDRIQLLSAGELLHRKYNACQERAAEAYDGLERCAVSLNVLRAQWAAQQKAQTRPIPRQAKNAGNKTIDTLLKMDERVHALDGAIRKLDSAVGANPDLLINIQELEEDRTQLRQRIRNVESLLNVQDRLLLRSMKNNKYLTRRVNALALKTRIRDRLRHRKFEWRRVERAFRVQSSERKLAVHASMAIHRHEPGIQALARRYNALCSEISELIRNGQAPARAAAPNPIDLEQLWALDVDDNIWQDTGLFDEERTDGSNTPPPWLADEKVREGIQHMLALDRCQEEFARLRKERTALQEWLRERWAAVTAARDTAVSAGLRYQLELRRVELLRLAVEWSRRAGDIPALADRSDDWGPTAEEMTRARTFEFSFSTVEPNTLVQPTVDNEDDDDSDDFADDDDDDAISDNLASLYDLVEDLHVNSPEHHKSDAFLTDMLPTPSRVQQINRLPSSSPGHDAGTHFPPIAAP
ncbi:hypothetical protein PUNSTDRAFT_78189 [Punctularia strigosozonata HHB-11173 SS5]|uniref:CxC1-like cysteine cluster associated with KDZ transposases domain-containing protein n=1 Tax=Punctularia strigosozonata (strain HHB-11173) TaxID=741275 RepID=R7S2F5_PUNST|nr:uncharacterized protein PUNSTDRAFT_78189 [Punctularia strigosozonata HHB-11173 SS5]EIN03431.1 hypothetical protein PUNSTDRAFT_78189 [Punctularia strigosozonata HHB-11173 SS5]